MDIGVGVCFGFVGCGVGFWDGLLFRGCEGVVLDCGIELWMDVFPVGFWVVGLGKVL